MTDQEKIHQLINNLAESLDVEVKNWLGGLETKDEKASLAKEIIALANHGGGYVFIGFEDEGEGHPEVQPLENEQAAYTQDNLASIIARYVTPACQCSVDFYRREGSELDHPVITVPGDHRTPVWAQRGSPDGKTLLNGTVYVRRPGGLSEPARTQDDWEKLLERLVKARQSDLLHAIRNIINPQDELVPEVPDLDRWDQECLEIWKQKIEDTSEGDGRRNLPGYWTVSFSIEPFTAPTLRDLMNALEREMPTYSGWRPFTVIHREPLRPVASGEVIEAWLAEDDNPEVHIPADEKADFWRVARQGTGFLLRPMQEDRADYCSNISPRPQGPFFDWTIPIYRMTEVLKFVEAMALKFSDEQAQFSILLQYYGSGGRHLQQHSLRYNLWSEGTCRRDHLKSRVSGSVSEIGIALEEKVYSLLYPIYEQFDFTELPKVLVDNVVGEALSY